MQLLLCSDYIQIACALSIMSFMQISCRSCILPLAYDLARPPLTQGVFSINVCFGNTNQSLYFIPPGYFTSIRISTKKQRQKAKKQKEPTKRKAEQKKQQASPTATTTRQVSSGWSPCSCCRTCAADMVQAYALTKEVAQHPQQHTPTKQAGSTQTITPFITRLNLNSPGS